mmetsp:Transcript_26069/g.56921  ORF Transcript_26069/g.56921 Transcript_26069/m.56921 type:complete len:415 (+) Transcript_26069:212-1456(+)
MLCTFQEFLGKLWGRDKQHRTREVHYGTVGPSGEPPTTILTLAKPDLGVKASVSGPEGGVGDYQACTPGFTLQWNKPTDWAFGQSVSLYEKSPVTGKHAGEPVADCFVVLAYHNWTILGVADGVNWGEPAKRAARCAVLGAISSLHQAVSDLHASPQEVTTNGVFAAMVKSLQPAQKLILAQLGSMTTLVLSVVAKVKSSSQWAAMSLGVGDSCAFVYRKQQKRVDEITYSGHNGAYRDPRWVPGALGYAQGDEADLNNMCCTLTLLDEGDIVFLTSDGVADNFDPILLKMARQAASSGEPHADADDPHALPVMDPGQAHVRQMEMMGAAVQAHEARCKLEGGALSARSLVQGLLEHVHKVTEPWRLFAVREAQQRSAAGGRSLQTTTRSMAEAYTLPGKMDHATVAAFQVCKQ